jgi:hypothetical protein
MKIQPAVFLKFLATMALFLHPLSLVQLPAEEVVIDGETGLLEVRSEVSEGLPGLAGTDFTVSILVAHNDTGLIPVASTFIISYDKASVQWLDVSHLQMGRAFVGEEREVEGRVERVVMSAGSSPMNTSPTPGCFAIRFRTIDNPALPLDIRVMPPGGQNFGLVASDLRTGLHPDIDDADTVALGAQFRGGRLLAGAEYGAMREGHRWIALVVGGEESGKAFGEMLAGNFGFEVRSTPAHRDAITAALVALASDTWPEDRLLVVHAGPTAAGGHGLGEWVVEGGALGCPEIYAAFGRMSAGEILLLANACSPTLTANIHPPVDATATARLHLPPPVEGFPHFLEHLGGALSRIPPGVIMPLQGVISLIDVENGDGGPRTEFMPGHGGGSFHFLRSVGDQ